MRKVILMSVAYCRAQRQVLFLDQLDELGWLDPAVFDSDASLLELAIGRYHQYLDVSFPTLHCWWWPN